MAGGEGFEPSQPEPESDVLPLDDPPSSEKLNGASYLSQETDDGKNPSPYPLPKGARDNQGMYQLAILLRVPLAPFPFSSPRKSGRGNTENIHYEGIL